MGRPSLAVHSHLDKRTFVRVRGAHEPPGGHRPQPRSPFHARRDPRRRRAALRRPGLRRRIDAGNRRGGGAQEPGEPVPSLPPQAGAVRGGSLPGHRTDHRAGRGERQERPRGRARAPRAGGGAGGPRPRPRLSGGASARPAPDPARRPAAAPAPPNPFVAAWPGAASAALGAKPPVYWNEAPNGPGFWVISKYHGVLAVQLDSKTFSSARGGTLIREFDEPEREAIRSQLINMDAPRHTRFRRLVNMGFSPKMTNRLAPHLRDMATRIIDAVAARGECDFVAEIAAELPLQVIAEMIGIPLADRHLIFKWSNDMIGFDDPEYGGAGAEVGKIASMQMYMYANQLAVERKKSPRDDVVSVLMAAEVDGEKLTEVEFDSFFLLLAVAGNETTRNLISGGMLALMQR